MNAVSNTEMTISTVQSRIFVLPNRPPFMLDSDLAEFYGVQTERVAEQVKRNSDRFPEDFVFRLTDGEFANLNPQNAGSSWGGRRKLPLAFTEAGAFALSAVLKTPRAAQVSVLVFRAFAAMRSDAGDATRVENALLRRFNRNLSMQLLVAKPLWAKIKLLHDAGYHWYSIKCQLGRGEAEYMAIERAMEDCGLMPSSPGIKQGDPDRQTGIAMAEMQRAEQEAAHAQG